MQNVQAGIGKESYNGENTMNAIGMLAEKALQKVFQSFGYIDTKNPDAKQQFKQNVISKIKKNFPGKVYDSAVVLCIGCDFDGLKADNVGPLVGSKLEQRCDDENIHVYGTMDDPIYGPDSTKRIEKIYKRHPSSLIIDVGAATSSYKNRKGCIHIDVGENEICRAPGQGIAKIGKLEVSPILIHRSRKDNDRDVWAKVSEIDGYTVNRMADITATCIETTLQEIREQGILRA